MVKRRRRNKQQMIDIETVVQRSLHKWMRQMKKTTMIQLIEEFKKLELCRGLDHDFKCMSLK